MLLTIATASSCKATNWHNEIIEWADLAKKLSSPIFTKETFANYVAMNKEDKLAVKDVGGFVGGALIRDGRRNDDNMASRTLLTIDIDNATGNEFSQFMEAFPSVACVVHDTHSSCEEAPRRRLIVPLDTPVNEREYIQLTEYVVTMLGDKDWRKCDKASLKLSQMMFWPSVSSDAEYYYREAPGSPLNVKKAFTSMVRYLEPEVQATIDRAFDKAVDPRTKDYPVGTFCRAHPIKELIENEMAEVYAPAGRNRYTYRDGSSSGGLILYPNKDVVYSHHSTDPANNGHCLNAYDLYRVHHFLHLDIGYTGKESGKPSYKAMEEMMQKDKKVQEQIRLDAFNEFKEKDLSIIIDAANSTNEEVETESLCNGGMVTETETASKKITEKDLAEAYANIQSEMHLNKNGEPIIDFHGVHLMISKDPILKGKIWNDKLTLTRRRSMKMPWEVDDTTDEWSDADTASLRLYLNKVYPFTAKMPKELVEDVLLICDNEWARDPIKEYLEGLPAWDGVKRVEGLLEKYLGIPRCKYTAEILTKHLLAGVARTYYPGIKYDYVLVLQGAQRCGKSTFIRSLSNGWISDGINEDMDTRQMAECLSGAWFVELAEMDRLVASRQSSTIKSFISFQDDKYRFAYERNVRTIKRRCIMFGTVNPQIYLKDKTGNKRYLSVLGCKRTENDPSKMSSDEVAAIWAEMMVLFRDVEKKAKEKAYMMTKEDEEKKRMQIIEHELESAIKPSVELEDRSEKVNAEAIPSDTIAEFIEDYLYTPLPYNWGDKTQRQMADYFEEGAYNISEPGYMRNVISIKQLKNELAHIFKSYTPSCTSDYRLSRILTSLGWNKNPECERLVLWGYGRQRIYMKENAEKTIDGKYLELSLMTEEEKEKYIDGRQNPSNNIIEEAGNIDDII